MFAHIKVLSVKQYSLQKAVLVFFYKNFQFTIYVRSTFVKCAMIKKTLLVIKRGKEIITYLKEE